MSSPARHRRSGAARRRDQPRRASDLTVYFAFAMIGGFIVLFSVPLFGGVYWGAVTLGYLALMAWLIHAYALRVYRGGSLAGWQQALAKVPVRFAGYGRKGGKPLEAAHDQPSVRRAILVSMLIWLAVLIALGAWVVPAMLAAP